MDGNELAHALIGDDPEAAKEAARELDKAPPRISDAVAVELARIIKAGGEQADAACRALGESKTRWFGGVGYTKLQRAILPIYADGGARAKAVEPAALFLNRGPDGKYDEKRIADAPPAGASWPARVWSVRRSIWVMALFGLVLLMGVPMMFYEPLIAGPLLLAGFALCAGIDGYRRRCPKCSMVLGAERVALIGNQYGSIYKWRCVGCQHRWEKQKYH
jgi:hypothetical protein